MNAENTWKRWGLIASIALAVLAIAAAAVIRATDDAPAVSVADIASGDASTATTAPRGPVAPSSRSEQGRERAVTALSADEVADLCPRPTHGTSHEMAMADPELGPVMVTEGFRASAPRTHDELAQKAATIVVGEVVRVDPGHTAQNFGFETVTIEVAEAWKGPEQPGSRVVMQQAACDVATGRLVQIGGKLHPRVGDRVLAYLRPPAQAGEPRPAAVGGALYLMEGSRAVNTGRGGLAASLVEGRSADELRASAER